MRPRSLLSALDGPPPSLPRLLDRASDRWWGLPPRARLGLLGLVIAVAALAVVLPRAQLGAATTEVVVAVRDLPAGHEVAPDDLRVQRWPLELAPPGASARTASGTLTSALPQGSVLTASHLGDGGLGALLTEGRAAVALPVELVPEAQAGSSLGLVVTDGIEGSHDTATPARVLRVDAEHVWVEIDEARAGPVAAAAIRRSVAVVVRPP